MMLYCPEAFTLLWHCFNLTSPAVTQHVKLSGKLGGGQAKAEELLGQSVPS